MNLAAHFYYEFCSELAFLYGSALVDTTKLNMYFFIVLTFHIYVLYGTIVCICDTNIYIHTVFVTVK